MGSSLGSPKSERRTMGPLFSLARSPTARNNMPRNKIHPRIYGNSCCSVSSSILYPPFAVALFIFVLFLVLLTLFRYLSFAVEPETALYRLLADLLYD